MSGATNELSIPRSRYMIVGVVLLVGVGLATVRSSGGATASAPRESSGGGFGISLGGGGGAKRVEVLEPRRGPISTTITAPGTIQAGSEVGIGAPFEGKVVKLEKDSGDTVEKDEVVFRLDDEDKRETVLEMKLDQTRKAGALKEAEAELAEAERKLADAKLEPSELIEARLRLAQAKLTTKRAGAQLEAADSRLKRTKAMLKVRISTEVDVETAKSEKRVAEISLRISRGERALATKTVEFRQRTWKQTQAELGKALKIARTRLARAKADQKAAKLALERARRDLARCLIRSPIKGIITSRGVNQGDLVARLNPTTPHYIVSDLEHILVYCDVDEGDVVHVAREQRARVTVNALGEKVSLRGLVYTVGYRARTQQGQEVSTFQVRILLAPNQPQLDKLRPGMSANAEIETARKKSALKIPIQAVLQRERKELAKDALKKLPAELKQQLPGKILEGKDDDLLDVVYVVKDGKSELRVVKLGIQDSDEVEVEAGLEPDLEVVVGPHRILDKLKPGAKLKTEKAENALPEREEADPFGDTAPVDSKS